MDRMSEKLFDEGLQFFGRITANLAHELSNVVSIVGELSGLLDDYLRLAEQDGDPLHPEKLQQLAHGIDKQTARGKGLIHHMNRFVRSIDGPLKKFDLGEMLENIIHLCERFARLKSTAIELISPEKPVRVTSNPFMLRLAVFACIDISLEAMKAEAMNEPIRMSLASPHHGKQGARITLRTTSLAHVDPTARLAFLEFLMERLDGRFVSEDTGEGLHEFTLILPTTGKSLLKES